MKIHLFSFDKINVFKRIAGLEAAGCEVDARAPDGPDFFKKLKLHPSQLFVIDLTRSPSQGRDIGLYLRKAGPTRHVPLLLVGGDEDKVSRVRELLPGAVYTSRQSIKTAIVNAAANPLIDPIVPASAMAGYSGAPLMQKLGIKEGMVVGLVHAPKDARDILGALPKDVHLIESLSNERSLYLWFLHSAHDLDRDLPAMVGGAGHGRIWMIWAKKSSPLAAEVTQQIVRDRGLSAGVD